ncbi:MAG: cytidylate kinase-like family protein [Treponema sp.]|nr:cytidylate kinase-like family protein [Treponema sp.]
MAIITFARQVAALGDEVAGTVAEKLNYKFIKRTDIERRIVELGFSESKMPKYDERKPGFFASMAKDRDEYFNLAQYAMMEAAAQDNVVIIGRGAFAIFKNVPNLVSVRLIADERTRISRLMNEFNWNEKQALQRIEESDANRNGFHKNFYNVDVDNPANFDMVLNTGAMDLETTADLICNYAQKKITAAQDYDCKDYIKRLLDAQTVVNKLIFDYNIKIEFLHAEIEGKVVVIYGVATSNAVVEQSLQIIRQELPGYESKSAVSVVQNYKMYQ